MIEPGAVRVGPWGDGDGPLLARLVGDPAMMEHLGGPEPADKIADRQRRYAADGSDQYRMGFTLLGASPSNIRSGM